MHVLSTLAPLALPVMALGAVLPAALQSSTKVKRDGWGGAVSLGPTTSDIIHAVTTIIPGTAPSTQNGELFLWPGMSNSTGDLIQTTLESWPSNAWCGATTGQWCVRASIFGSFGQLDGTGSPVSGDDHVQIVYNLESDGETWVQNVTNAKTGAALSSYSYPAGPYMTGYGTGTECDDDCSGTIASQLYLNTTITLRSADTSFGDTIAVSGGGTYEGLTSSEDGKVWNIATISIPAMTAAATSTSTVSHATPVATEVVSVPTSAAAAAYTESASPPSGNAAPSGAAPSGRAGLGHHHLGGSGSGSGSSAAAPSAASGFGAGAAPSGAVSSQQFGSGSSSGFGSDSGSDFDAGAGSDDEEPCPEY